MSYARQMLDTYPRTFNVNTLGGSRPPPARPRATREKVLVVQGCEVHVPAVDVAVVGEAQAMLVNYEHLLVSWFGDEAQLGAELVVPLQLSQLRGEHRLSSLKRLQAELPVVTPPDR